MDALVVPARADGSGGQERTTPAGDRSPVRLHHLLTEDGSSSSGASTTGDHPPRVRVPLSTMRVLEMSLAGPPQLGKLFCCSTESRVRAWVSIGPLLGAAGGGYAASRLFARTEVPLWVNIGYVGFCTWVVVGVTIAESTQVMARAFTGILSTVDDASAGESLDDSLTSAEEQQQNANVTFLAKLLRSHVSAPVGASIRRAVRIAIVQSLLFVAVLEFNFLGTAWAMATWENDALGVYAMLALALVSVPIMGAIMCGFLLFFKIPCVVAADRIRQEAARIRAITDTANADWNAIMGGVQHAHEATVRIGALMRPPLTSFRIVAAFAGSWWFMCAIVPHDSVPEGHPLRAVFTGPVFFALTCVVVSNGVLPVYFPVKTSEACEELVNAIADLRHRDGGRGGRHGSKLANPPDLIRIDGVCRYATELNRGQGLGFTFMRLRIDNTFILETILKTLLGLSVVYAAMCELLSGHSRR